MRASPRNVVEWSLPFAWSITIDVRVGDAASLAPEVFEVLVRMWWSGSGVHTNTNVARGAGHPGIQGRRGWLYKNDCTIMEYIPANWCHGKYPIQSDDIQEDA